LSLACSVEVSCCLIHPFPSLFRFSSSVQPEALDEALECVTKLNFRPNALRYAILIGDAGPHGIGYSGDSYPNGSPNGLDWLEICDKLAAMQVAFFTCVTERAAQDARFVLFMDTVAKKTRMNPFFSVFLSPLD